MAEVAGVLLAFLAGSLVGSFLATVHARWRQGPLAALRGRSRCDRCGRRLSPAELVPLVSWLVLRGRCRSCGEPIAFAHFAVELSAGLIATASLLLAGWPAGAPAALLGWYLLLLSLIDLEEMRLPDALTLPLLAAGVLLALAGGALPADLHPASPASSLLGAATACLLFTLLSRIYAWLRGRPGLGGGDAKLAAAAGAWLGIGMLPLYLLLAGLLGIAFAVSRGALRTPGTEIPFGPALGAALWFLYVTG